MEYLRWILLVAGLVFVLVIYLLGKNRRNRDSYGDYDLDEEAPEFSAKEWDELEEGVGAVRIIARESNEYDSADNERISTAGNSTGHVADEGLPDDQHQQVTEEIADQSTYVSPVDPPDDQPGEPEEETAEQPSNTTDIIVLYILARSSHQLSGDKINSAARANGLIFGKMNIFHRFDSNGLTTFSLANMVEPGNFDPDAMHDLQTPGIIFFMQASDVDDPDSVFDDMLECAYHMSEMLDAQLSNHKRQPFMPADAEYYREQLRMFRESR